MNPFDDDWNEMSADLPPTPESGSEPVLGGELAQSAQLTQFLAELRTFADEAAPPPSPELAALLGGATPIEFAPSARRKAHWHRRALAVAAVGAATLGLTGVAAAKESLPQPAQRVVSDVVNDLTPFHLEPSRIPVRSVTPSDSPEDDEHSPQPSDSAGESHSAPSGDESSDDGSRDDGSSDDGAPGAGSNDDSRDGESAGSGDAEDSAESSRPSASRTSDAEDSSSDRPQGSTATSAERSDSSHDSDSGESGD